MLSNFQKQSTPPPPYLVFALFARVCCCLVFALLAWSFRLFVISTFTPILVIEISFVLLPLFHPKNTSTLTPPPQARRSAEIVFGDAEDPEYLDLKNYKVNPQRMAYGWSSNNSVGGGGN